MTDRSSTAPAWTDRPWTRRGALAALAGLGIGTPVFQRALATQIETTGQITAEMLAEAEWITGIELEEDQREDLLRGLRRDQARIASLREMEVGYDVLPSIHFNPAPGDLSPQVEPTRSARPIATDPPMCPDSDDAIAFLPVTTLAQLIRDGSLTSIDLTRIYLDRLKKANESLNCVVTLTEQLARKRAEQADAELVRGNDRGPLHGIPYGLKDLVAYPGFPTTWGAPQFRDQMLSTKATLAQRLDEAGAVLIAKLSLGALAQGDRWFKGMTRNPWNPEQGSSGSSAGSASATAAGLVGFSIGSETLGSIVSPSRRCGTTGLRPTFGRVSRHGCMALSWTMDKLGPITRSVEDAALVFDAIHGRDGLDPTVVDKPFTWPPTGDLKDLKVGYVKRRRGDEDREDLKVLRELGVKLVPIELPQEIPAYSVAIMLSVEAAAAFDPLTRTGDLEGLNTWPNTFRSAEYIPAVEYIRAARIRSILMEQMSEVFEQVDLYVGGNDLVITNLTGHPTVVMPGGFRTVGEGDEAYETPSAITFTGRLYGETELMTVAHAYQQATGHHLKHPQ